MHRRRLADFPFWLLALALLGVIVLWTIVTDQGYAQIFRALSGGVLTTIWVTLVAFALATNDPNPALHAIAWAGALMITLFVLTLSLLTRLMFSRNKVTHE